MIRVVACTLSWEPLLDAESSSAQLSESHVEALLHDVVQPPDACVRMAQQPPLPERLSILVLERQGFVGIAPNDASEVKAGLCGRGPGCHETCVQGCRRLFGPVKRDIAELAFRAGCAWVGLALGPLIWRSGVAKGMGMSTTTAA